MRASDAIDYSWLDADSGVAVASCFSFFEDLSIPEVLDRGNIQLLSDDQTLEAPQEADDTVALFAEAQWTVLYEDNGYPERLANRIASAQDVIRVVIVFWNVNAVTEFALWERGQEIVAFEWPDDRRGIDPDRLLVDMRDTVGLRRSAEDPAITIYRQMLSLSERLTGVHINVDFLDNPSIILGFPRV